MYGLEDLQRTEHIYAFYHCGTYGRRLGSRKASLIPKVIYYGPFQGGTFKVVLFVKCSVVFHLDIFLLTLM